MKRLHEADIQGTVIASNLSYTHLRIPMKAKTIGVIGLGSIGLRHKNNLWQHLGQTEVIGYDPQLEKNNGTGWVIGDLNKMIEMSDALIIASPTDMHVEHIVACGNKPVFVEKPIGASQKDYDILIPGVWAGSDATSTIKMVGYNLRFHGCVQTAKGWLEDGIIGDPLWANFTLGQRSIKPPYLRDGVILNWSHEIDLALHLLGGGSVVHSGTRLTDGRDDLTDILLIHENGCRSAIHLDYLSRPECRQSIIVGTEGRIIMDLVSHNAWLQDIAGSYLDHMTYPPGWDQTYIDEMKTFLALVDGHDALDGCTTSEAMDVLNICLEVRKQAGL